MKFWPLYALLIAAWVVLLSQIAPASAHDWYIGTGCCYGDGDARDCDNVPFGAIREVEGGFIVTLTKVDMLMIRPRLRDSKEFASLRWGVQEFVPQAKAKPAQDGEYSVCLKQAPTQPGNNGPLLWILCFFYPTNS